MQRFEREAKTISQLSHPHICALSDVGNQDCVEFLVMEYLQGETLSDRLARGLVPLEQLFVTGSSSCVAQGRRGSPAKTRGHSNLAFLPCDLWLPGMSFVLALA